MKYKKFWIVVALVTMLGLTSGCNGIEKRTQLEEKAFLGGAMGTVIGAGAGHASAMGMGPGALIGLSLGMATGVLTTEYYYDDPDSVRLDASELENLQAALAARDRQIADLEERKQATMEAHRSLQAEMDRLRRSIGDAAHVTNDDTRGAFKVTILGDVMFASGSASLTSEGQSVLARTAGQIREQFPNAYIEIRGHTDSDPITHSDWRSNWELSTARAVSVLHYLVDEQRFNPEKIWATGFADTVPVASNRTDEGKRQNRRAEIVIYPEGSQAARELEVRMDR